MENTEKRIDNLRTILFYILLSPFYLISFIYYSISALGKKIIYNKKVFISDQNREKLINILTRLIEILIENSYRAHVSAVKKPLYYLMMNGEKDQEFLDSLFTVEIYGGSGAVWELGYFNSKESEIEFMNCFINLSDTLIVCGIKNGRAKQTANIFRSQLKKI